jgi:hypothetical protein
VKHFLVNGVRLTHVASPAEENEMANKLIRFPVHCPICKKEWTSALEQGEILDALDNDKPIRVYAQCHSESWDLGQPEREILSGIARTAA